MSRSLTAQDRSSLIRLASSLPAGSPERKAILAGFLGFGAARSKRGWPEYTPGGPGFDSFRVYNKVPTILKPLQTILKKLEIPEREHLNLIKGAFSIAFGTDTEPVFNNESQRLWFTNQGEKIQEIREGLGLGPATHKQLDTACRQWVNVLIKAHQRSYFKWLDQRGRSESREWSADTFDRHLF